MTVLGDEDAETFDETRRWVAFAHRFLEPDAYRHGTVVVAVLGVEGASAMAMLLRRVQRRVAARDALACSEASSILLGDVEDLEAIKR